MTAGNVLYVVKRYPELTQTFITNEVQELRDRGWRVRVAHLDDPLTAGPSIDGVTATRVGSGTLDRKVFGRLLLGAALRHPVRLVAVLARVIGWGLRKNIRVLAAALTIEDTFRSSPPERIHAHFADTAAEVGLLAAMLLRVPYSFTTHAIDLFVIAEHLDDLFEHADVAVTVCDYNRRWIHERWPDATMAISVCGVDPEAWRRSTPHQEGGPVTIVSVARLVEKKGLDDLVDAVAMLVADGRDVQLRIHGDGPETDALQQRAKERGIADRVALPGPGSADVVKASLEASTIFCLPCVVAADGDRDAMPVSIKEAMSLEMAVVGTREVGIPEMIDDGVEGWLAEPRDPASLHAVLDHVLSLPTTEVRAAGRRARERVVRDFTLAQQVDALEAAWRPRSAGADS